MSKLRELKEKRNELIEKVNEIVEAADAEERDLTEDEAKEFDSIEEEITKMEERIKRQEAIEARTAKAVGDHSADKNEPEEVKRFSYMKYIQDVAQNRGLDGYHAEVHQEAVNEARQSGVSVQGSGIPYSLLNRQEKRDQTAGTNNQGGFTVQTDIDGQNFIDSLKNRTVLIQAGAQMLTGLQGDVAFPKFTEYSFAWEGETDANAETTSTVSQVTLSPERVGGFVDISKRLMLQSSMDIEAYVRGELVSGVSRALQQAAINGTGTGNQPTGILTLSTDINEIEIGTNGGPMTWALAVALESAVNNDNAPMGRSGYVTNSKVLGDLKTISKDSGSGLFLYELDQMNGHPVYVTNQVPSNLTKGSSSGVCSAIIYSSDWAELMMGMWGGIDLLVDPYTQATSNIVRLIVNLHADVAVRNEQSFAFYDDVTTNA